MENIIPVTKPFLPPKNEYLKYLDGIWERNWLTNNGPLVIELENQLQKYLAVENILYVTNGTVALQFAIKALGLQGEIITTPFSYVATVSSIVWEGCEPVFVDIDPRTLNMNPELIEAAITEKTTGILATHVFGNPCDIETIQTIADKHGLKVIYDAAHCFGTTYKGKSVFNYGDISTASFHATKIYQTIEGGALITKDTEIYERVSYMRNFGHDGPEQYNGLGINGKNSEFHAAMGLCNLNYMNDLLKRRKEQYFRYDELLEEKAIRTITIHPDAEFNYAYYAVIFESERVTLQVKRRLEGKKIFPRRYFYPSLCELDYVEKRQAKVATDISTRILCLPLYHDLSPEEQSFIVHQIQP